MLDHFSSRQKITPPHLQQFALYLTPFLARVEGKQIIKHTLLKTSSLLQMSDMLVRDHHVWVSHQSLDHWLMEVALVQIHLEWLPP